MQEAYTHTHHHKENNHTCVILGAEWGTVFASLQAISLVPFLFWPAASKAKAEPPPPVCGRHPGQGLPTADRAWTSVTGENKTVGLAVANAKKSQHKV